jgi:hypothetical protein
MTGDCTFDGKIGIWPFVERVTVQRNLGHPPAGMIETQPFNAMAQKYSREFMIEKVLPAIKLKWPDWDHKIIIQ